MEVVECAKKFAGLEKTSGAMLGTQGILAGSFEEHYGDAVTMSGAKMVSAQMKWDGGTVVNQRVKEGDINHNGVNYGGDTVIHHMEDMSRDATYYSGEQNKMLQMYTKNYGASANNVSSSLKNYSSIVEGTRTEHKTNHIYNNVTPNIRIEFGDVRENADVNVIARELRQRLQEEMLCCAEGVY